jgi:hypothetical protein
MSGLTIALFFPLRLIHSFWYFLYFDSFFKKKTQRLHLKNYQIDFEIVDHYSLQQGGHIHLVDYLFECGARLRDLNSKKETPIDVAAKNHHQQIVSMLLEQEQRENVEGCSLLE